MSLKENDTWVENLKDVFDQSSYKDKLKLIAKARELGFISIATKLETDLFFSCGVGQIQANYVSENYPK